MRWVAEVLVRVLVKRRLAPRPCARQPLSGKRPHSSSQAWFTLPPSCGMHPSRSDGLGLFGAAIAERCSNRNRDKFCMHPRGRPPIQLAMMRLIIQVSLGVGGAAGKATGVAGAALACWADVGAREGARCYRQQERPASDYLGESRADDRHEVDERNPHARGEVQVGLHNWDEGGWGGAPLKVRSALGLCRRSRCRLPDA